jgi:hypothetical protein
MAKKIHLLEKSIQSGGKEMENSKKNGHHF